MRRRLTKLVIFLVLGALGMVLALSIAVYWQLASTRKGIAWVKTAAQLRVIWTESQVTADDPDGAYPPHAAVLLVQNYVPAEVFLDPRGFEDSVFTVGDLDLTGFFQSSKASYQWSEYSDANQLNDQLDIAVAGAANDSVSFYRFGDFWFMRLPRETNSGKVIFAWANPGASGARIVVYDNGDVAELSGGEWWPALKEDALERQRLGLPLIDPAPP